MVTMKNAEPQDHDTVTANKQAQTVTIAGVEYTVERWNLDTVIISKRGTAYMVPEGISNPWSFPGGTPLRKHGNAVKVINVGGIIEQIN